MAPRAPSTVRLEPGLKFLQSLWALDHELQSASKRMKRSLKLTGPQRLVLRIVSTNPGIGAGPLAQTLRVHPSTLTGVLRRLEEQRLLRRQTDPRDARRVTFTTTPLGNRLVARNHGTVESAVAALLRRAPPAEIESVEETIAELCGLLQQLG